MVIFSSSSSEFIPTPAHAEHVEDVNMSYSFWNPRAWCLPSIQQVLTNSVFNESSVALDIHGNFKEFLCTIMHSGGKSVIYDLSRSFSSSVA